MSGQSEDKKPLESGVNAIVAEGGSVTVDTDGLTNDLEIDDGAGFEVDTGVSETPAKADEKAKDEQKPEDKETKEEDAPVNDLGDYSEATKEAYEKAYYSEGGKLNVSRLSQEYWAAHEKDPDKAGLPEGTYKFLEAQLGLPKEQVKAIEEALVVRSKAEASALFQKVGGEDTVNAALEWGRTGGYTQEQRDKFNAAIRSADPAVREEAYELLVSRYNKASGVKGDGSSGPDNPARRRSVPARDLTSRSATPGPKGDDGPSDRFKTLDEYQAAFRKAYANVEAARGDARAVRAAEKELSEVQARRPR